MSTLEKKNIVNLNIVLNKNKEFSFGKRKSSARATTKDLFEDSKERKEEVKTIEPSFEKEGSGCQCEKAICCVLF